MTKRNLPGCDLLGFWPSGLKGWNNDMDGNMRKLSALVQLSPISMTTALPGSPTNGDIYIVPADSDHHANEVAVRDVNSWVYYVPKEGWHAFVKDTFQRVVFDGSAWVGHVTSLPGRLGISANTPTFTLTNEQSGAIVHGYVMSVGTIVMPASPKLGCEFTFIPFSMAIKLDFNGNPAYIPGIGGHNVYHWKMPTLVENAYITFVYGYDVATQEYRWRVTDHLPYFLEEQSPLTAPLLKHGSVRFDYDGAGHFTLKPKDGNGLIIDRQMHRLSNTGLVCSSSVCSNGALNYFYAGNMGHTSIVGVDDDGTGKIKITLEDPIPHGSVGDTVRVHVYSVGGCTEANDFWDGIVTDDVYHVVLVGSTFENEWTEHGDARIDYIFPNVMDYVQHPTVHDLKTWRAFTGATLIGMAYVNSDGTVDPGCWASWFNTRRKVVRTSLSANASTSSASFVEADPTARAKFVTWGIDAEGWCVNGNIKNSVAANGWAASVGFNGTTAETAQPGTLTNGAEVALTFGGNKTGLTEGYNYATILTKAVGGTVTVATPTCLEVTVSQ